jgi:hypothetical protein
MLSQVRQAKEDARPVHNHSSSLPPTTLMATKDLRVHPLINPATSFFFVIMHCNCQNHCRNFDFYIHESLKLFKLFRPRHSQLHVLVSICLA